MNIPTSFTVYTAALHALILILFYLLISGSGYPGLIVFQQLKHFPLQKQAAESPTPAAGSRRGTNTVLKSLKNFLNCPRRATLRHAREDPPHQRGHRKTKETPFCRSLAAAEPRIGQPQRVRPPPYPWRPLLAEDLPVQPPSNQSVSACDLPSLQSSSHSSPALEDTCSTPDIPR